MGFFFFKGGSNSGIGHNVVVYGLLRIYSNQFSKYLPTKKVREGFRKLAKTSN